MTWHLSPDREKYKFRTICIGRNHPDHFDETTYLCPRHGLIDIQCCIECEQESLETPGQKKQQQIELNERIIIYHQNEIGRLCQENLKLLGEKRNEALEQ